MTEKPTSLNTFHGVEVMNGQEVVIPSHYRHNALGIKLQDMCPSTTGIIIIEGGYPNKTVKARCEEADKSQKCFYIYY